MSTRMIRDAEQLLAESPPAIRKVMAAAYEYFVSEAGCDPYVKTIYVGFMLGPGLLDAAHLTWRTMPVAVEVRDVADLKAVRDYMATAVERVRTGAHDVELPQERFMGRERRIADQTILGKRAR